MPTPSTPYLYSPLFSHFSTPLLSLLLSLAVVECQRAGLKSSAYNYAVMLMSPDYRQHIEASIKKKIEAVVRRKSQQEEEAAEELSMCPISM
jgi:WD repeat-containing protein 19